MNILVVSQYFYPENTRVNRTCQELVERGHNVTVLTGYPQYPINKIYDGYGFNIPYQKLWNGIEICRVKAKPRGSNIFSLLSNCFSFVIQAKKWIKKCKTKYDAIYCYSTSPITMGIPGAYFAKKFNVPLYYNYLDLWPENVNIVLKINNPIVNFVINKIKKFNFKYSTKILCPSHSFEQNVISFGVPNQKVIYYPQFTDDVNFASLKKPSVYSNDYTNIVFTGNLGDSQGLDDLIDIADKTRDLSVRYYLVGDGRARDRLQQKTNSLRLNNIFFMGRVSEKEANCYVHYADLAYLSYSGDKLFDKYIPAKMQTYLACGTPILLRANGECSKIIQQAKCGYDCGHDTQKLIESIKAYQHETQQKIQSMKNGAINYSKNNFDKVELMDKLEKIMQGEL